MKAEFGSLPTDVAEYVFFPLSHLFRQARSLPSKALELSLRCLQVLLGGLWCRDVQSEAHLQLLKLLTYLITGPYSSGSTYCPDEGVLLAALGCLGHLFNSDASGPYSDTFPLSQRRELILGYVTSTLIDCVSHPSNDISVAASKTLTGVILAIQSRALLRKFTPGIMSTIIKFLQPSTWSTRSSQAVVAILSVLESLLFKVLAVDDKPSIDFNSTFSATEAPNDQDDWLSVSYTHIRHALLSVLQIKALRRSAVTEGLFDLCYSLLSSFHSSLDSLMATLLETLLELSSVGGNADDHQRRLTRLTKLLTIQPSLTPLFKGILRRWLLRMSRLVVSHDTVLFHEHLGNIVAAYEVAKAAEVDIDILNTDLTAGVLESATTVLDIDAVTPISPILTDASDASHHDQFRIRLQDPDNVVDMRLITRRHCGNLEQLGLFIKALLHSQSLTSVELYLAKSIAISDERPSLAHLWISSRIIGASFQQGIPLNRHTAERGSFFNSIYSSSLKILATSSLEPTTDWRMRVIALEIVALYASMKGTMFRAELVDGLYPVIESIASSNPQLRECAWICINSVSQCCGYTSPTDLVLQNADYIINSVALKMNISSISLEAPRVLAMMVRICGNTIVPYLDDTIDSVFSTLTAYHGYSQLVEALFDFLSTVVSVSGKSRLAENNLPLYRTMRSSQGDSSPIAELVKAFLIDPYSGHDAGLTPGRMAMSEDEGSAKDHTAFQKLPSVSSEILTNAASVRSIVAFGQHYLTHDSPILRCQILRLMGQSCDVLYNDENRFLPLVHEIWPVVVGRLYDFEASVCIAACSTITSIVRHAGEFMQTRIEDEWIGLSCLYSQKCKNLERDKYGRHNRAQSYYIWDALTATLCDVVGNIEIKNDMEDSIVVMLMPYYFSRDDVRCALDSLNQDAIWLRKWLNDELEDFESQPHVGGHIFLDPTA